MNKVIVFVLTVFCFHHQLSQASVELASREKVLHVLNRFSYGPRPGEIADLEKKGTQPWKDWFESQMKITPSAGEETIRIQLKNFTSLRYSNEEMLKAFPQKNKIKKMKMSENEIEGPPKEILVELTMQKLLRAIESENQLYEVMTDFWFNHFNVNFDKGVVRQLITSYERDVIRPHVFGKFEDLLMAIAKSPAMLIYLDNNASRSGKINENYARELLELHTLGVDGGYEQKDIQEAARILTGWGVEKPRVVAKFKFFRGQHDDEKKMVLGQSFSGRDGILEGEKLIRFLANHPKTAEFIAKKLAIKFISDRPKAETIQFIAAEFKKSGGDLKQVYRAVLNAPEFFSRDSVSSKIKTPLEFFASLARATKADFVPSSEKFNQIKMFFEQSGQPLYRCQPPTGFKAASDYWVNPGAMVNRINLSLAIANGKIHHLKIDLNALTEELKDKKFSSQLPILKHYNDKLFNAAIKEETLKKIDAVLSETKNYLTDETKELPLSYYKTERLLALTLSSPEFQRR